MVTIFTLLIAYQIKHFVADYPLQGEWMLGKFKSGWCFLGPLVAHVCVHGFFTFLIVIMLRPELALQLASIDMIAHFTMDRIKAAPHYLGRFKPLTANEYSMATPKAKLGNKLFWWSIGFDQMVHHLTHYYIIWRIVSGS